MLLKTIDISAASIAQDWLPHDSCSNHTRVTATLTVEDGHVQGCALKGVLDVHVGVLSRDGHGTFWHVTLGLHTIQYARHGSIMSCRNMHEAFIATWIVQGLYNLQRLQRTQCYFDDTKILLGYGSCSCYGVCCNKIPALFLELLTTAAGAGASRPLPQRREGC
jgi:hypothetical protein